jgi:hypothetical protein
MKKLLLGFLVLVSADAGADCLRSVFRELPNSGYGSWASALACSRGSTEAGAVDCVKETLPVFPGRGDSVVMNVGRACMAGNPAYQASKCVRAVYNALPGPASAALVDAMGLACAGRSNPDLAAVCARAVFDALPGFGEDRYRVAGIVCAGGNTPESAVQCVRSMNTPMPGPVPSFPALIADACRVW